MYDEELLDRSLHPLHQKVIEDAEIKQVLTNASCGDELAIFLRIKDGVIVDGAWEGYACAIAQASAEFFIDTVVGKRLTELNDLKWQDVPELENVKRMPARQKCASLPWKMIKIVVK